MKCPRCDYIRRPGDRECPKCGIDYAYVEQKIGHSDDAADPPLNPSDNDADSAKPNGPETRSDADQPPAVNMNSSVDDASKNVCPKCGFGNPDQSNECLRCGIIFSKYEAYLEKKRQVEEETNQTTDGLLDPETIRAAAESSQPAVPAPAMAKTACPHCSQRYQIRDDQIGITTRCKKCSSIFKIEAIPTV